MCWYEKINALLICKYSYIKKETKAAKLKTKIKIYT